MGLFDLFSRGSSTEKSEEKNNLPDKNATGGLVESLLIPEPTRSLLWLTHDDTSKIEHAGSITISISISDQGVKMDQKQNGFYSEPSLIWTKLPIKRNHDLYQEAMYWPSYSSFSPEIRYQYLRWLGDITQPTNLSFVFLYFYGLERHLLVGNYDAAVDEIARLLKAHPKRSFIAYASQSLIVASLGRDRLDVIDRVPSLLEEEIDEALALRVIRGTSMTPEDIISVSSKVGFNNKRYITLYPDIFKQALQEQINEFEQQFGSLLSNFKLEDFKREDATVFANLSIPENIRHIKVPIILEDKKFSSGMYNLLQAAHDDVKARIASGNIKVRSKPVVNKPQQPIDYAPVTEQEINKLINSLQRDHSDILDLHFAILESISDNYRKRANIENYHKAKVSCMAQIKIQAEAANQFHDAYPGETLPMHTGYNQLAIILEKEKKFAEALELAEEAKANGWNGDWDRRIEKLQHKI